MCDTLLWQDRCLILLRGSFEMNSSIKNALIIVASGELSEYDVKKFLNDFKKIEISAYCEVTVKSNPEKPSQRFIVLTAHNKISERLLKDSFKGGFLYDQGWNKKILLQKN